MEDTAVGLGPMPFSFLLVIVLYVKLMVKNHRKKDKSREINKSRWSMKLHMHNSFGKSFLDCSTVWKIKKKLSKDNFWNQ